MAYELDIFIMLSFVSLVIISLATSRTSRTGSLEKPSYSVENESLQTSPSAELTYSFKTYSSDTCLMNGSYDCSPWSYCDNNDGTCKCNRNNADVFKCDTHGNRYSILTCYCLTLSEKMNTTEVGLCIYNCYHLGKTKFDVDVAYITLPNNISDLNDAMCGMYNRTGTLCGDCVSSTYLRAYSYDLSCTNCAGDWSNWIKYIVVAYVPLTIFYIVILVFKINIPSSHLQGYVLFCQILSSPISMRALLIDFGSQTDTILYKAIQVLGTLYGIWNLDFFRLLNINICFQANPLTILSLDFFVAVYPLVLMMITYKVTCMHDNNNKAILAFLRPFKAACKCFKYNMDIKTSTIDSFATFMFLSNIKLLNVCFDLLLPVYVCDTSNNSTCRWAVFYYATMPYFSHEHLPYAIPAILVLLMLVVGPVFILLLYPFSLCQKCLIMLPQRWKIMLYVFMDSFQGCYKDGTEPGTRDCR